MKYYLISNSISTKDVGRNFIQTEGDSDYHLPPSLKSRHRSHLNRESFPDQNPILDLELSKSSKITDVVSVGMMSAKGFFMNDKARSIFEEFLIINHKFYPGTLNAKGEILNYHWLHLVNDAYEGIDFKKSVFMECDYFLEKSKSVIVDDSKSLMEAMSTAKNTCLMFEKLVFEEDYIVPDLFFYPQLHYDIVASERLVDAIVKNKITGLKFVEAYFS